MSFTNTHDETEGCELGVRCKFILLTNWFDHTATTWFNQPDSAGTSVEFRTSADVADSGYTQGTVRVMLEVPDDPDDPDGRPVKIYGAAYYVYKFPGGSPSEQGSATATLQKASVEEDSAYLDPESGIRVDYVGEWEDGQYRPPVPVAYDGTAETKVNTPVEITMVATDFDAPDDELEFEVEQPDNGSVGWDGPLATYIPDWGFTGTDTFTFKVKDSDENESNEATITVTVEN